MTAYNLEKSARKAIQILRKKKLQNGYPFMIHSEMLDSKQCFMEYPDGRIKVVEASPTEQDFRIVLEYTLQDSKKLKKKLNLL